MLSPFHIEFCKGRGVGKRTEQKILFLVLEMINVSHFFFKKKKIFKRTWNLDMEKERLSKVPRNEQHVTCGEDFTLAVKFRWRHMGKNYFPRHNCL